MTLLAITDGELLLYGWAGTVVVILIIAFAFSWWNERREREEK